MCKLLKKSYMLSNVQCMYIVHTLSMSTPVGTVKHKILTQPYNFVIRFVLTCVRDDKNKAYFWKIKLFKNRGDQKSFFYYYSIFHRKFLHRKLILKIKFDEFLSLMGKSHQNRSCVDNYFWLKHLHSVVEAKCASL